MNLTGKLPKILLLACSVAALLTSTVAINAATELWPCTDFTGRSIAAARTFLYQNPGPLTNGLGGFTGNGGRIFVTDANGLATATNLVPGSYLWVLPTVTPWPSPVPSSGTTNTYVTFTVTNTSATYYVADNSTLPTNDIPGNANAYTMAASDARFVHQPPIDSVSQNGWVPTSTNAGASYAWMPQSGGGGGGSGTVTSVSGPDFFDWATSTTTPTATINSTTAKLNALKVTNASTLNTATAFTVTASNGFTALGDSTFTGLSYTHALLGNPSTSDVTATLDAAASGSADILQLNSHNSGANFGGMTHAGLWYGVFPATNASSSIFGVVKVDGTTITSAAGVISAVSSGAASNITGVAPIVVTPGGGNASVSINNATSSTVGAVKPDNTTISISSGILSAIGAPPTGAAGGALANTYPNPDIASGVHITNQYAYSPTLSNATIVNSFGKPTNTYTTNVTYSGTNGTAILVSSGTFDGVTVGTSITLNGTDQYLFLGPVPGNSHAFYTANKLVNTYVAVANGLFSPNTFTFEDDNGNLAGGAIDGGGNGWFPIWQNNGLILVGSPVTNSWRISDVGFLAANYDGLGIQAIPFGKSVVNISSRSDSDAIDVLPDGGVSMRFYLTNAVSGGPFVIGGGAQLQGATTTGSLKVTNASTLNTVSAITVTATNSINADYATASTASVFDASKNLISSVTTLAELAGIHAGGTIAAVSGVNLTALNATALASGTVADARLSANVPLLNAANVFSASVNTFVNTSNSGYGTFTTITNAGNYTGATMTLSGLLTGATETLSGLLSGAAATFSGLLSTVNQTNTGYIVTLNLTNTGAATFSGNGGSTINFVPTATDSSGHWTWQAATGGGTSNYGPLSAFTFMASNFVTVTNVSQTNGVTIQPGITNQILVIGNELGNTTSNGLFLSNPQVASTGNQMFSPAITFDGQGWKTTATAASQDCQWQMYLQPVQGAANPTSSLLFKSAINGAAFANTISFSSVGGITAINGDSILRSLTLDGNLSFSPTTDGITGTTAADNVVAGKVGEFPSSLVAAGSAVSLTTATAANITSISLTAGDWDVEGSVNFTAATATVSQKEAGISTTSATLPTDGSEVYSGVAMTLLSTTDSIGMARKRVNVSGTTTVYLVGQATFSAGTVSGYGTINARRAR